MTVLNEILKKLDVLTLDCKAEIFLNELKKINNFLENKKNNTEEINIILEKIFTDQNKYFSYDYYYFDSIKYEKIRLISILLENLPDIIESWKKLTLIMDSKTYSEQQSKTSAEINGEMNYFIAECFKSVFYKKLKENIEESIFYLNLISSNIHTVSYYEVIHEYFFELNEQEKLILFINFEKFKNNSNDSGILNLGLNDLEYAIENSYVEEVSELAFSFYLKTKEQYSLLKAKEINESCRELNESFKNKRLGICLRKNY